MEIIEALERDEELRKRLTKLIVSEIVLDPELKFFLVEKSLKTLATKNDVKDLKNEIKEVENRLRNEIRNEIKNTEERLKSYVDAEVRCFKQEN